MNCKKIISFILITLFFFAGFVNSVSASNAEIKAKIQRGGDSFDQITVGFTNYTGIAVVEYSSVDFNGDPIIGAEALCRNDVCTNTGTLTDTLEVIVSGLKSTTSWTVAYEDSGLGGSPDTTDYASYPAITGTGNGTFTQSHSGDSTYTNIYIRIEPDAIGFESSTPALDSITSTQAVINVDVDTSSTVYAVMVPDEESSPNASQIITGQNSASSAPTSAANIAVNSGTFSGQISFSGLTGVANKEFNIYVVAQDSDGYQSVIPTALSINFFDTDNDVILNDIDPDDDNDGVPDADDDTPLVHGATDTDGDGVPDYFDFGGDGFIAGTYVDASGVMLDNDGDGASDYVEAFPGANDAPVLNAHNMDGALEFDGLNDYVALKQTDKGFGIDTQDFSLAMWLNPHTSGSQMDLFTIDDPGMSGSPTGTTLSIALSLLSDGKVLLDVNRYSGGRACQSLSSVPLNKWSYLTVSSDGFNSVKIYLDGIDITDTANCAAWQFSTPTGNEIVNIGRSNVSGGTNYFNGEIDEFAFWATAISQASALAIYNEGKYVNNVVQEFAGSTVLANRLEALYAFSEGSGTSVADLRISPNYDNDINPDADYYFGADNTGTINGATWISSGALTFNVVGGRTAVSTIDGSDEDGDDLTYTLSGADSALFSITSAGALSFTTPPVAGSNNSANADDEYEVTVTLSDGTLSDSFAMLINVLSDTTAPTFDSNTDFSQDGNSLDIYTLASSTFDVDIDEPGIVYGVMIAESTTAPSVTQIIAGTNNTGNAALGSGSISLSTGSFAGELIIDFVNDVANSESYDFYFAAQDTIGNEVLAVQGPLSLLIQDYDNDGTVDRLDTDNDNDGVPDADDDTPLVYGATDTDGDGVPDYFDFGGDGFIAGTYVDASGVMLDNDGDGASDYVEAFPGANDAPVISSSASASVTENQTAAIVVVASDANGDTLTYSLSGTDSTLFNINSTAGFVTFRAAPNFESASDVGGNNVYNFTVTVTDDGAGTLNDNQAIAITVTDVNDVPIANNQSVTTLGDTAISIILNAIDVDSGSLTYSLIAPPLNGTLTGSPPNLSYTANANYVGADSFTFIANDGAANSNVATVNITATQTDTDGDGISDGLDAFPNDPNESVDTDGDGIGNNADPDRDGDDVNNDQDAFPDDATEATDTDGDGVGDNSDPDMDGDGIPNAQDSVPLDNRPDTDGDGIVDELDAFPNDPNESVDTDGDGIGNNADLDRDGDGVNNDQDAFPDDVTEATDTDGDGVGNNSDPDMDGDGIPNAQDSVPLDNRPDTDGDGIVDELDAFPNDANESIDTDGDGIGNNVDPDRDGDGVPDSQDQFPDDNNAAGDIDDDGIDDLNDDDIDGDGISNEQDNDANGDGVIDEGANNIAPVAVGDVVDVDGITVVSIDVLQNDTDINQDVLSVTSVSAKIGNIVRVNNQVQYTAPENFTGRVIAKYIVNDGNGGTDEGDILININTRDEGTQVPLVLPPDDVLVNATGLFTRVDLGIATATDSNGVRLPVSLVDGVTFFKPGRNVAYWEAVDDRGNRTVSSQNVLVRPLVSFGKDQVIQEGKTGKVKIVLNGESPEYPLDISFAVAGSADTNDHSLRNRTVSISSGLQASGDFSIKDDGVKEGEESIELTFTGELNSVSDATHIIRIVEQATQPELTLSVRQMGQLRFTVSKADGMVTVLSAISGENAGTSYIYEWVNNSNLIDTDNISKHFTFSPSIMPVGVYKLGLDAISNNPNTPTAKATIDIIIVETLEVLSGSADTDGDGITDSEEGYNDSDGDGIADYADANSQSNVIPAKTNVADAFLVEGEPGVSLRIGATSITSNNAAAIIDQQSIVDGDIDYANVGGIFDFEIRNIATPGSSSKIVLPQVRPIPISAVYRKYSNEAMWSQFFEDADNSLASATGEIGYCPPPNLDVWTSGLVAGYWCVRLTIEDGGPNDTDGLVNGAIVDPSGVAILNNNNQLPVAQNDTATMRYNTSITIDVLANDTDADGDALSISEASSDFGEVSIVNDALVFMPIDNYFGNVTIDYAISDGSAVYSYASVQVTIFVNNVPSAADDSASTDDRTPLTFDVLANDSDPDGDTLNIIAAQASRGSVTIVDNMLLYTPTQGLTEVVQITYTIADQNGLTAEAILTVSVTAYEVIEVRNDQTSSGGSMNIWLSLLLSITIMTRRLAVGAWLLSFLGLGVANAQQAIKNGNWHVNVGLVADVRLMYFKTGR